MNTLKQIYGGFPLQLACREALRVANMLQMSRLLASTLAVLDRTDVVSLPCSVVSNRSPLDIMLVKACIFSLTSIDEHIFVRLRRF
jgi:hypothetical protein